MELFQAELRLDGVPDSQIIAVNLEDFANEGCSVRGTKDEIMAEIFTERAPAQEDLEDDFEL